MDPFVGEIKIFAGPFAPKDYAFAQGQIMSIAQNSSLFSIIGTRFGGNGTTTFALPNLGGCAPMHWGSGPGLTPRNLGDYFGVETVLLDRTTVPPHNHAFNCNSGSGDQGAA